jgi:hypothetical protein
MYFVMGLDGKMSLFIAGARGRGKNERNPRMYCHCGPPQKQFYSGLGLILIQGSEGKSF